MFMAITNNPGRLPLNSPNPMLVDNPEAQENILAVAFHNTLLSIASQMTTMNLTFQTACEATQRQLAQIFDDGREKLQNSKTPEDYKAWSIAIQESQAIANAPLDQVGHALQQATRMNNEAQGQNDQIVKNALKARASMIETSVKAKIENMVAETHKEKEMQAIAEAKQRAYLQKAEFEANQNRMNEQQKNANLQAQLNALTEAYNAELTIAKEILNRKGLNCSLELTPPRIEDNTVIPGTVKARSEGNEGCVVM